MTAIILVLIMLIAADRIKKGKPEVAYNILFYTVIVVAAVMLVGLIVGLATWQE